MALKKKVLVGTLATTLAVGAFAGLPLSGKGLAAKLGAGVASAAVSTPEQDQFKDSLKSVYEQLKLIPNGEKNVKAAYSKLIGLTSTQVYDAASPIASKFTGATADQQKAALSKLLAGLVAITAFPPSQEAVEGVLSDGDIQAVVDAFKADMPETTLTREDIFNVANEAFYAAGQALKSTDYRNLDEEQARSTFIYGIIDAVSVTDAGDDLDAGRQFFNDLIEKYYTTGTTAQKHAQFKEDLMTVFNNFAGLIGADVYKPAVGSLALAFMNATNSGPIYVGGGGVSNSVSVSQALATLSALKDKLANATDEEKAKLIKEALDQANAALTQAAAVNVAGKITVDGDKASVAIAASDVAAYVDAVKQITAALTDAIGSADGLVIPSIAFDLGTVSQANVATSIPADVLTSLSGVNIPGASVIVSGLTATLPITGDFAKGIDFGINKSAVQDGQTKGLTSVSDVYNFSLSLGGEAAEQFAQPIVVKFPVKDVDGVDKELLSVVRIESDGSLSPQGGDLDGNTIIEPRYTFSSYTVVENKVSFNDIDSVQSWAGRQIEVIAAKGAIEGKSEGVFAPKDDITRAEFAKILITALNLDNSLAASDKFSDVKSSDWFAPYVAVAADKGIINGRSATKFDPTAKITRAEMATMISRALKVVKGIEGVDDTDVALAGFSDAGKINPTLKDGVALAASKNIVIGDNGKFRPNDNANRAEAAVIIYRAMNTKA